MTRNNFATNRLCFKRHKLLRLILFISTTMKIISFDVGIKNMAYCILDCTQGELAISGWGILNLMDKQETEQVCSCMNKPKSKKTQPTVCTKKAKYMKNDTYYCDKHAKGCSQYIIPTKQMQPSSLKKLKVDDLIKLGNKHLLFLTTSNPDKLLKKDLLAIVMTYFEKQCYELVVTAKHKTASGTDLIEIGRNMKKCLGEIENLSDITNVVIENQISPIANRMKTIQGMLAQYFIMTNESAQIAFISSANKLKQFASRRTLTEDDDVMENTLVLTGDVTRGINPDYKAHKKDGVYYCLEIINKNNNLASWRTSMDTKKKDDLADAFLQGIWYLRNNNNIIIADDLKIKLV